MERLNFCCRNFIIFLLLLVAPHILVAKASNASSAVQDAHIAPGSHYLYNAEHLKLKRTYFTIPVVYNEQVEKWIRFFTSSGRDHFTRYAKRAGRYVSIMSDILAKQGLPRDLIFLAMAESGFHNMAKSSARAKGPWQFMPSTAKEKSIGLKINFYVDERFDFIKSTIAAGKLLTLLYRKFDSWELAMAAYNAGERKIDKAQQKYNTENFWAMVESNKKYLKSETKNYLPKIYALAIIGKNLESFGFADISFEQPLNFQVVELSPLSDLFLVAEAIGSSYEQIKELNPELLRWFTPPYENYNLRLPEDLAKKWSSCCAKKDFTASLFSTYQVTSKDTLSSIEKKFNLPNGVLADLNGMAAGSKLQKGDSIRLPFREGHSLQDAMYSDLMEALKPTKGDKRRSYRERIRLAQERGTEIASPLEFYVVQKGDTLWDVSKKTGVSLDTIIKSNYKLISERMIRAGDKLVIR